MTRRRQRPRDRGAMAIEVVIAAPVMLLMVLLVMGGARYVDAHMEVTSAAAEAARAASLERDPYASVAAGREAATATLDARGKSCASLDVDIDVTSYEPGGQVSATVLCRTDLSDITMSGMPGSTTFEGHSVAPIEQYREQ